METPGHDLVIGGSGMLAGLVERLAQEGRQVTVVARGEARLRRLADRHRNIHPLSLDYTDAPALQAGLARATGEHGRFARCVAWMHDDSTARALAIARSVSEVYCEVLGSASADPARPELLAAWRDAFQSLRAPRLRLAVLGFAIEGGRARWLTDTEICTGVGRALESVEEVTVVGTVEPWSARP